MNGQERYVLDENYVPREAWEKMHRLCHEKCDRYGNGAGCFAMPDMTIPKAVLETGECPKYVPRSAKWPGTDEYIAWLSNYD